MKRMVILPSLFRPPDFLIGAKRLFSGLSVVIESKSVTTLKRCPGVIGFNFFNPIFIYLDIAIKIDIITISQLNDGFLVAAFHAFNQALFGVLGLPLDR